MEVHLGENILELPFWFILIMSISSGFFITYIAIPSIVAISRKLKLYERTKSRGSHKGSIPTLGGVAIFAGIVTSGAIFYPDAIIHEYRYVLAAMVILFFTGVKDDLVYMNPRKKLIVQLFVALIVILLGDIRITTFHGFLGIEEIPYVVSVIFSVFVYIVLINGFNLIDGIDGLASGVAFIATTAFGILFIFAGEDSSVYEPFILSGSLAAFFIFNVFSSKNKIFLGDTGSLTVGFVIATITINFLECGNIKNYGFPFNSVPSLAIGILIVPLFDTLRVFTLRIFGGDSPFHADRKHIHHRLLDLGFTHLKSTLIILCANLLIIAVALLLQDLRGSLLFIILMLIAAGLSYIPVFLIDRRKRR